ncbi:MAG: ester cyclase [Bacteroidetes bacterium]|nr:ester cyclase [Bacteroidota bacterium]
MDILTENKETALAVSKAIMDGRWKDLDALLDDGFTYTGDGLVFTKDEYIGFMQDLKSAFSGLNMTFPHILAEGDLVSVRFISTAVNTGSFMGAPANRKNLEIHGIFIRKVANGKVLQEWQTTDLLGVMRQIGFGALIGHALAVGLFKLKQKAPVKKPW